MSQNAIEIHQNGRTISVPEEVYRSLLAAKINCSPNRDKKPKLDLEAARRQVGDVDAQGLIEWAAKTFDSGLVMTTSFGIHSAVMLHLVTRVVPEIPVIWIDTGYLPAETYKFAEELTQKLNLNLKVYQSLMSPDRMEALYGRLWEEKNLEALNLYDQIRKVEPMQRALKELGATAWLAGLRKEQTGHRKTLQRIDTQGHIYKILPIFDWNSRDVYYYLSDRELPCHPYFDLGYTTVGDWHSSRPVTPDDKSDRDTRFQGIKQECGLHLPQTA